MYFLIPEAENTETHISVFGHWVELEEEWALNNLTHLTEKMYFSETVRMFTTVYVRTATLTSAYLLVNMDI